MRNYFETDFYAFEKIRADLYAVYYKEDGEKYYAGETDSAGMRELMLEGLQTQDAMEWAAE